MKAKLIELYKSGSKNVLFDKPGTYLVLISNISADLHFEIAEKHIDLTVFGLYSGKNSESYSLSIIQHHSAPLSRSSLHIKGIFDGNSSFIYKGLIKIEKEAQNSWAYQKNQSLIISPGSFVSSSPDLEIQANRVYCTHATTIGKVSQEEMRYLQSRGIGKTAARNLIIRGFLEEIPNKIRDFGFTEKASNIRTQLSKQYD